MIVFAMTGGEDEKSLFERRYLKYHKLCMSFAMKIVKHDTALAEDAVHETFLAVLKKRREYLQLGEDEFKRVVITIVKNKCIDILRKSKRLSQFSFEEAAAGRASEESGFEAGVAEIDLLRCYLERIDMVSRRILEMKYVEGLTYKQIADTLGMKPKTVEVRTARAKEKIKKMFIKDGEENAKRNDRQAT